MDQTYEQMVEANWMGGKAEGTVEALANLLKQQLQQKFGAVPKRRQRQLDQASPETLNSWGRRLLDAKSLEAVFGR